MEQHRHRLQRAMSRRRRCTSDRPGEEEVQHPSRSINASPGETSTARASTSHSRSFVCGAKVTAEQTRDTALVRGLIQDPESDSDLEFESVRTGILSRLSTQKCPQPLPKVAKDLPGGLKASPPTTNKAKFLLSRGKRLKLSPPREMDLSSLPALEHLRKEATTSPCGAAHDLAGRADSSSDSAVETSWRADPQRVGGTTAASLSVRKQKEYPAEESEPQSSSQAEASSSCSTPKPSKPPRVQLKKIQLKESVAEFMEEVGKVPPQPNASERVQSFSTSPTGKRQRNSGGLNVSRDASQLKVCPFCSKPLPGRMTRPLLTLLQSLLDQYHLTGGYVGGQQTIDACMRHDDESVWIPRGLDEGWPTKLDTRALRSRVKRTHWKHLLACLEKPEKTRFFLKQMERVEALGQRALSATGQMDSAADQRAGYYGERGWETLLTMCLVEFLPSERREPGEALRGETDDEKERLEAGSAVVDAALIAPLTPTFFIHSVLLPELIVSLLQEDLRERNLPSSFEDATALRDKSTRYGSALFPVDQRMAIDPVSVDRLRNGLDEVDKGTLAAHWASVMPASRKSKQQRMVQETNIEETNQHRTTPVKMPVRKRGARPAGAPQATLDFLVQRRWH